MNREKKGGSRLEKKMPKKGQQTQSKQNETSPEEEKQRKLPKWAKILLIVLAVLAVVAIGLFIWYKSWAVLPDLPTPPAVELTPDEEGNLPEQSVMSGSTRKDGFYTFLVAGKDTGGGGNTDTMMLVAYDIPNQKLAVMSLPRDTMVDARHPDRNRKLNGVWNLGLHYAKKDEKKEGVEYLKEAVGDMVGFVPDFYVIVSWEGFGRLINTIGGVEFDVPFDMNYDDPTQSLHIHINKGKQLLKGEQAMGVVRWRKNNSGGGYASGDLGRIQTQQAFMTEVVKKCLKIENVTKINEFAKIFTEEVDTNLTVGNLVAFAERAIFGGLKMDNVIFTTMPNTGVYVNGESYVQANPEELLGILNDSFNPYKDDIPMEALHIQQYSAARGYYIYDGTGTGVAPTYTNPKPATVVGGNTTQKTETSKAPEKDTNKENKDNPNASASPSPSTSADPGASASPGAVTSARPSNRPDDDPAPSNGTKPSGLPLDGDRPDSPATTAPSSNPEPAPAVPPVTPEEGQPAGIPMD